MSQSTVTCQSGRGVTRRCSLLPIIMALCLCGCVAFPLSSRPAPVLVGKRLEPEVLEFISVGVTTREDLIMKLGQPSIELEGFKILAYPWTELSRTWVVGAAGRGGGGFVAIPDTNHAALFIAIDEGNHVLKWGIDQQQRSDKFSIVAQARRWAESNGLPIPATPPGYSAPAIAPGHAVLVLYRAKPDISAIGYLSRGRFPEAVGVAIDDFYRAELLDGEYVIISLLPGSHRVLLHPVPPYRYWPDHPGWKSFSGIHSSTVVLDVSANKLYFLEAQATLEVGLEIVTSLRVRDESEAGQALATGVPIW